MPAAQVFQLVRRLREELKVNTTCGASNVSFGLPNRHAMNGTFLAMAIGAGMTSAIMNPLHPEEMGAVRAADVLNGHDPHCRAGSSERPTASREPGRAAAAMRRQARAPALATRRRGAGPGPRQAGVRD